MFIHTVEQLSCFVNKKGIFQARGRESRAAADLREHAWAAATLSPRKRRKPEDTARLIFKD